MIPPAFFILFWLGISTAMHSFPSTGDAKNIWKAVWDHDAPFSAKVVGTPLVGLIYLGAIGSVFWLDLIYGVAVVAFIPEWLPHPMGEGGVGLPRSKRRG